MASHFEAGDDFTSLPPSGGELMWQFRLYIAGQSTKSLNAVSNLRHIFQLKLSMQLSVEVIDLLKHPELAERDQVVAIPTLVRIFPEPACRVIGDLSNIEKTLAGLQLTARD